MHLFKNFDWSLKSILKAIGALLLFVVAITLIFILVGLARDTLDRQGIGLNKSYPQAAMDAGYGGDFAVEEMAMARNESMAYDGYGMVMPVPEPSSPTGDDLEDYEVKNYNANVSTRRLEQGCQQIANLKAREEVIFESSDQNEDNCYFYFKVEKEYSAEIVALIESMDPDYFNQNTQTIKGSLDYYSDEMDILTGNLEEVEAALKAALAEYDEVSALAASQADAETLATLVSEQLDLVQRLNEQRMQLRNTLQRYEQNKAEQLDRLNYDFFNVSLYKDVVFDWDNIKENWKMRAREMVYHLNQALQGLTVLLVGYIFVAVQWVIYFVLLSFVAKGLWLFTKRVWKIGQKKK